MNITVNLKANLHDNLYGFSNLLEKYNGKLTDEAKLEIKELISEDLVNLIEQCTWDIKLNKTKEEIFFETWHNSDDVIPSRDTILKAMEEYAKFNEKR